MEACGGFELEKWLVGNTELEPFRDLRLISGYWLDLLFFYANPS